MMDKQKKIFIADDDADILTILRLMLKTKGYQIEISNNANDIFNYKKEDLPDLVLLDIWMSGIDGRDICTRLKQNEETNNIPVIFISANSRIKEITEEAGAQDYISKPFEMDFLLKKIHDTLYPGKS